MKKIIFCMFIIILFCLTPVAFAVEDETLDKEKKKLGIEEFVQNSEEYKGEFWEDIDIKDILDDAINGKIDNNTLLDKVFSLFGKEFLSSVKTITTILAIIVIHSILKTISDNLENEGISKLIFYVQFILIVTIVMTNFSSIIQMVRDTCINLVAFMNMLVPLLISLMLYTGNIQAGGVLEPIILFMINFVGNMIQGVILPLVIISASIVVVSKLSDEIQISKIAKFLQSGIVWFLGIILTIFVGVVSLEGTLANNVDSVTAKATKTVVSTSIPIVGKILGDATETVLGCGIILKNAVGLVGILIILGLCIVPILKMATLSIMYKLLASVCQPIADKKIVSLIEQIGDIFKIFLAILAAISVMLIIGTALVMKMSSIS